jgi:hypothetical protein
MKISGKNIKGEQLSLNISREQFEETFKSVFIRRYNIIPDTIKIEKTWDTMKVCLEDSLEVVEEKPKEMLDTVANTQSNGGMEEPQKILPQVNPQSVVPSLGKSWKQSILRVGKKLQLQLQNYINNYKEWQENQQ